jgi:hypothetical protein
MKKLTIFLGVLIVIIFLFAESSQGTFCDFPSTPDTIFTSETVSLNSYINVMKTTLPKLPLYSFHNLFELFIKNGVKELHQSGYSTQVTLGKLQRECSSGLFNRGVQRHHRVLMNFYPDIVVINTSLPIYTEDASEQLGISNATIEFFIKIVPLVDTIETQNRIFLRTLTQKTSVLGPAIGIRLIESNTTVFILAFGSNIQRSWHLF